MYVILSNAMNLALQTIFRSAQRLFTTPLPNNETLLCSDIANQLRSVRTNAGLSHLQLAKRIGTTASTVSRFEDTEFNGHSLFILDRLADALDCRLQVRFVPKNR